MYTHYIITFVIGKGWLLEVCQSFAGRISQPNNCPLCSSTTVGTPVEGEREKERERERERES